MDFFLNWCINCGKRSEYLYCCKECRLNDLKKKTTTLNENDYTLEFKNRKPFRSHSFYKSKGSPVNNPVLPFFKINIPSKANNNSNRNGSFSSSTSTRSSSTSDITTLSSLTSKKSCPSITMYSSPPKENNNSNANVTKPQLPPPQRPRYYIQTFHNIEPKYQQTQAKPPSQPHQPQQLLTPLSERDNMDYETTTTNTNVFMNNQMYSEEEVNENSSHWYWSSDSDDEDDEYN